MAHEEPQSDHVASEAELELRHLSERVQYLAAEILGLHDQIAELRALVQQSQAHAVRGAATWVRKVLHPDTSATVGRLRKMLRSDSSVAVARLQTMLHSDVLESSPLPPKPGTSSSSKPRSGESHRGSRSN